MSLAGGDAELTEITEEAFDNIYRINLRGTAFACKHALLIMREQRSGVIINISSAAAVGRYPYAACKATKAGVVALTEQLALQNASHGICVNCVLPGLISTPMAVETRARTWNQSREQVLAERVAKVPLGCEGTGWESPMRRSSLPPTRRTSSPGSLFWWTAVVFSTASKRSRGALGPGRYRKWRRAEKAVT